VNTKNPDGQVKAEIKKYKIEYPVHFGRGQKINRDFKVKVLPRLILINADRTVYKDVPFMKADELRGEIEKLLGEDIAKSDTVHVDSEKSAP